MSDIIGHLVLITIALMIVAPFALHALAGALIWVIRHVNPFTGRWQR